MDREVLGKILTMYGLAAQRFLPMQKGYRNRSYAIELQDGRVVNLILCKSEPGILTRITSANTVSNFLAASGMPARSTLDTRILRLSSPQTKRYAALYHYLPGHTIPWEAYTMRHLKLLGKTMSDMHAALARFTSTLPNVANDSKSLNERMLGYFADSNVASALRTKLNLRVMQADFRPVIESAGQLPGQQALHMDFVRGNILFDGGGDELAITGIIDFEKTGRGHVVFDIARTLAFLLVDCKYKSEAKVRKYFLYSGYHKRGASNLPGDTGLLEALVGFYLLHDFYKFLRHNPYESLPANEHFVRTRDLLKARHIIQ